jgi:MipA family protein
LRRLLAASLGFGSLFLAPAAQANFFLADDFTFRVGAVGLYTPDYMGSDDYEVKALPDLELTYQDRVYLSGRDGLGIFLFNDQTTRMGVGVAPNWGRDEDDNDHLTGLGDVDFGWDMKMFLEGRFAPFMVGIEARHEFAQGSGGTQITGYTGFTQPVAPQLLWTGQASVSWADTDWTRSFFAVTPTQAAASGLPVYNADDGLRDASLTTGLIYALTPSVGLTGMVGYTRLLDDAADSPISQTDNQFMALVGASYSWPVRAR